METIQNTSENSLGNSRRIESLKEELLDYQFQYIEKIEKGELNELIDEDSDKFKNEGEKNFEKGFKTSFEKKLFGYTNLNSNLWDECERRLKKIDPKWFGEWVKGIISQINNEYISGNKDWAKKAQNIIVENLNKVGPIIEESPEEKEKKEKEKNEKKIGLIHYNLEHTNLLNEFGINKNDDCLSIHIYDFFEQKGKDPSLSKFSLKDSFSKLAIRIVEKYPEVRVIIGRSWLLDSPIGKKMEFNIYKRHKEVMRHAGSWGQFITENGEINKEKMKKFLDTGIPEFFPVEGFIKVEDFLRKYLPPEKRGPIQLKELTEESKKNLDEANKMKERLNNEVNTMSKEEIISMFNESRIISEYIKTEKGKFLYSLILKAKELNTNIENLDMKGFEKDDLRKDFMEFLESLRKYQIKEVII